MKMTFSNVKRSLILSSLSIICSVRLRAHYKTISQVNYQCFEAVRSGLSLMTINNEKIVHCLVLLFRIKMTLYTLICRWAGGCAEKDIHKMDQLPLGKGRRVCVYSPLLLPALYCPLTQTQAPVFGDWKLPHPTASSCVALPHLMWLGSKKPCRAGHGTDCAS